MTVWDPLLTLLLSASPAQLVQAAFVLTSCAALAIIITPSAERKLLLNYGPRRTTPRQPVTYKNEEVDNEKNGTPNQTVRKATSLGQVPHSWFFTFYAFYILCAAFWAMQYFRGDDNMLRLIAGQQVKATTNGAASMAGGQVALVWTLMLLQAGRRLYECFAVMKPSQSTMWFVHWALGMGFYLGVSVAIWVEGSGTSTKTLLFMYLLPPPLAMLTNETPAAIMRGQVRLTGEELAAVDTKLKTIVALPLFTYGWIMQHSCHKHLASLKKYSLPDGSLFRWLVCPHYTCECLIYLSLAIAAAPVGQWCNRTLLTAVVFVAVNLGVTANGTKTWYIEKFGPQNVVHRWAMIPFLY